MLIIDVRDFRPKNNASVEVDEDDIAIGLSTLGEGWKSPLALRVRIKPMKHPKVFAKVERVNESDDEWRINIYVPIIKSDALIPKYTTVVNAHIGRSLAKIVRGRGHLINPEVDVLAMDFVSVKWAQGSK